MENLVSVPTVTLENYAALAARTERLSQGLLTLSSAESHILQFIALEAIRLGEAVDQLKVGIIYGKPISFAELLTSVRSVLSSDYAQRADRQCRAGVLELDPTQFRVLHGALGLVTEAIELLQPVMAHLFNGAPLDMVNVMEESGDLDWYQATLSNALGYTLAQQLQANIAKLAKRYGEKYSFESAMTRDLPAERRVLEQHAEEVVEAAAGLATAPGAPVPKLGHFTSYRQPVFLCDLSIEQILELANKAQAYLDGPSNDDSTYAGVAEGDTAADTLDTCDKALLNRGLVRQIVHDREIAILQHRQAQAAAASHP